MTHFDFLTFPDTCHPDKQPFCYSSREDQDPLTSRVLIPTSSPLSLCPFFSCAAISIGVRHASTPWLISLSSLSSFFLCGSSNPLSLVFYFLIPPFFASSIAFLHVLIPTRFFVFVNVDVFPLGHISITSFSGDFCPLYHIFNMWFFPPTLHVICLDWTSPLQLLASPSHRSLNGLSPTTISPCSHSHSHSFPPSPLSLSR